MPQLTVITGDSEHKIQFTPGSSVREILDEAGVPVRSGCLGNGACGLCLVRVEAGKASSPTPSERLFLPPEQLDRNTRFACQLMPESDLCIRIINTVSKSNWQELSPSHLPCTPPFLHKAVASESNSTTYGLAVDLGTTHISFSVWNLKHGSRVSSRMGLNPQRHYGADVVTRLIAAGDSTEHARTIAGMPLDAVHDGLIDVRSRNGFSPGKIDRVTIVGNAPMLAILTQSDSKLLLQPRYWERPIDCRLDDSQDWVSVLGIHPQATLDVVAPLAGFVGSDLLAGVLATRLTERPGGLLIDFGTNSEVALWDGATLWVTSAAGGPAFESSQTQCGMPAESGAIYRADRQQDSHEWRYQVIGGGKAKGLCGSGLVDLIACLRSTGDLTSTGKFRAPGCGNGFMVSQENPSLRLTHRDVDAFQRAKAAIGVGIKTLLASARMDAAELTRVCICGAFGQHLNPRNAQAIGLLPPAAPECVELCGNTALAGCERLLVSPDSSAELTSLRERARLVNLSTSPGFDNLFLENLYLQPLKGSSV